MRGVRDGRRDLASRMLWTARAQRPCAAEFGIFYDRPFDNLWQNLANNNIVLATANPTAMAGELSGAGEFAG